jgi:23S rRNA (uracil-5-)-methyltransferase RumA
MNLNIGDRIKLDIRKQGINGEGVGYYNRVAVFVPGSILKETVNVEIVKTFSNYAIGSIIEIDRFSKKRVTPKCKFFDDCDGCQLQHIDYLEQLKIKQSIIKQALRRYTSINIEKLEINKTLEMEEAYCYRNRSEMVFRNTNFGLALGYFKVQSSQFVFVDECVVNMKEVDLINQHCLKLMRKYKQKAFDNRNQEGILLRLLVNLSLSTKSASVVFVVRRYHSVLKELANELLSDLADVKSISYSIDDSSSNNPMRNQMMLLAGTDKIEVLSERFKLKISPAVFDQANLKQVDNIEKTIEKIANISDKSVVFDFYCNAGRYSLLLAKSVNLVYAVDYSMEAIKDASINAKLNGLENIKFIAKHVETALQALIERSIYADLLILDPPRSGISDQLIALILEAKPKQIIYVSSNPSTLAKNIALLNELYKVKKIIPIDFLPQNIQVDSITQLELK